MLRASGEILLFKLHDETGRVPVADFSVTDALLVVVTYLLDAWASLDEGRLRLVFAIRHYQRDDEDDLCDHVVSLDFWMCGGDACLGDACGDDACVGDAVAV